MENNQLTPENAKTLITNFKAGASDGQLHSVFFTKIALQKLLNITGCEGLRFHLGKDVDNKFCIIAQPTDSSGVAIPVPITVRELLEGEEGGDEGYFTPDNSCPDDCPPGGN